MDPKVFVGGLAWHTNEQSLQQHFSQYGEIEEVRVIMDKVTGRSKGYGFVVFKDPGASQAAVANGFPIIDGKQANCNLASLGVKNPASTNRGRKRYNSDWAGYGGNYGQQNYSQPGFGDDYAILSSDDAGGAYGYENTAKRRKFEPAVSYLQILQQVYGISVTKETATAKIEELRISDPTEAFKYFLEVSEVFKGSTEYDSYMTSLLEGAKAVRRQQAESEGFNRQNGDTGNENEHVN